MAYCDYDKICVMVVNCLLNRFAGGIATQHSGDGSVGNEWRWDVKFDNSTIKVNGNNELYVDFTGIDTDTILNNPHFGAGAPAGFSRLYYDLYNKLTNTLVAANYTFVDIPNPKEYKTASGVIFAGGGAAIGNSGDFWLDNSMQFIVNNVFAYNTEMNFTVRIELDTTDTPSSLDLASVGFGVVNQTTGIPNGVDAIGDYGWQLYSPDQVNLSAHKYTYVGSANLTLLPGNNNLIMYMRIITESGNPYQFTFGPHKVVWFSYLTHA